jgi:hypothetical protein
MQPPAERDTRLKRRWITGQIRQLVGVRAEVVVLLLAGAVDDECISIAYQVVGEGELDLLFVPGFASNLIWNWELPSYAHFLRRLSSFSRLIVVDRRGFGLPDRLSSPRAASLRDPRR